MPAPALHLLPVRTGAAAENMALDFLLLQRYPESAAPRFRHYEWRRPAFTFGYSQKVAFVRAQLPAGESPDLCRRPTGGGIVDHRSDWTYTLVLPRGHTLCDAPAPQSYRAVHEALAGALRSLGQPAAAKLAVDPAEEAAGVCFQRAELYDVVNSDTGAKIAGAAMKRNKHGLLLQGSVEKNRTGPVDWEEFHTRFAAALGRALAAEPAETPWPELNEDEVGGLIEQYSSPEWIESR
jgi:lipoate-protein ligase A